MGERLQNFEKNTADLLGNMAMDLETKNKELLRVSDALEHKVSEQHRHFTAMHLKLSESVGTENSNQDQVCA